MSFRSFTVPTLSVWKKGNLDLRPTRIRSLRRPRNSAFHVVARRRDLSSSAVTNDAEDLEVLFTHLLLVQAAWRVRESRRLRCAACKSGATLSRHLQPGVSVKRHLSRICPCLTRSLARCLSRALRQLRGSASHYVRPAGFGFQKIFSANLRTERGRKDFPNLPKKRRLALGAGHLTSLRARVSRVRTGQIQTGEKQWHSTKTKSL